MKIWTIIVVFCSVIGLLGISGFTKDKNKSGEYVLIPKGSAIIKDKTLSFDSYWISAHEITNKEYNEFLIDLKNNGKLKDYETCKVQNDNWITMLDKNKAQYSEHYSSNEAYGRYPVLNISYEAAQLYCKWLTENYEDQSQMFRLPTKEEWIYAASGGFEHTNYSWGGSHLRNKKGVFLCNFKHIGDEFIHADSENNLTIIYDSKKTDDSSLITEPVDSYSPNEFGLYNACGNASEMIDKKGIAMGGNWNSTGYDVQITSEMSYDTPNPFVGFRPVRVKKK